MYNNIYIPNAPFKTARLVMWREFSLNFHGYINMKRRSCQYEYWNVGPLIFMGILHFAESWMHYLIFSFHSHDGAHHLFFSNPRINNLEVLVALVSSSVLMQETSHKKFSLSPLFRDTYKIIANLCLRYDNLIYGLMFRGTKFCPSSNVAQFCFAFSVCGPVQVWFDQWIQNWVKFIF